ncbi:30S ribosomal protein THX [Parapedobacter defluvii]|nr:30S ribosomal protein THX [Parapedobacter defluvii]
MGKGDKKTKRGKIVKGTYGKRRQSAKKRKKKSAADTENAAE